MAKATSPNAVPKEEKVQNWIVFISVLVPLAVAVLLFMPAKITSLGDWVFFLPHLNAVINTAASLALILAIVFVKQKNISFMVLP